MDPQTLWPTRVRTALLALALVASPAGARAADIEPDFEVWLVDQSNSPGKTYGGQISIYDGTDISGYVFPALTTITSDPVEWGRVAARTLLQLIAAGEAESVELPPAALLVRASTSPPPSERGTVAAHS